MTGSGVAGGGGTGEGAAGGGGRMTVWDATPCTLGEGPLWHPERAELFWFDILGNRLLARKDKATRQWGFAEHVSAAGWVDRDTLLLASETGLWRFGIEAGTSERVAALEADDPATRSNDGRADPWGGFWIGTMAKDHAAGAGAIYRYFRGEVRRLYPGITVPNAIAFAADGGFAHFADTRSRTVMRVRLSEADGWPTGEPEVFVDLRGDGLNPDGAVVDADGLLWIAQWGAGRVAAYDGAGRFVRAVEVAAPQASCPAFGGEGYATLFCTTAREGMDAAALKASPKSGMTFAGAVGIRGRPEPQVAL